MLGPAPPRTGPTTESQEQPSPPARRDDAARPARQARPDAEPAGPTDTDPPQHYLLTLRQDVRIQEGIGRRVVTGDLLTAHFTSRTEGLAPAMTTAPRTDPPPPGATPRITLTSFAAGEDDPPAQRPAASEDLPAQRSIAPPLGDDDVYITCTGGLTLRPVNDPRRLGELASPTDALVTLTGQPVELLDRGQETRAVCDHLVYRSTDGRIELIGTEQQPLLIHAPKLAAGGDLFWTRRDAGGFTGAGWMTVPRRDAADDDDDDVRVTWQSALDLDYDRTPGGPEAALRRATFRGDVRASDPRQTMWADLMDVSFTR